MDPAEKRRLKKLGKQLAEERSQDIADLMQLRNPAPAGSDEWAKNYTRITLKEKELRNERPDIIQAAEAERDFIVRPIEPPTLAIPTIYLRCLQCHELLHSLPVKSVTCSCGNLSVADNNGELVLTAPSPESFQWVRLKAKSTAQLGFANANRKSNVARWWQFWRWLRK